jgi:hypothetical protein
MVMKKLLVLLCIVLMFAANAHAQLAGDGIHYGGGGTGSMTYPGVGIPYTANGSSWGTSFGVGTMTDTFLCSYATSGNTLSCNTNLAAPGPIGGTTPSAVYAKPAVVKGPAVISSFAGTVSTSGSSTTVTFTSTADAILAGYNATNPILGFTLIAGGFTRYIQSWTNSTTCVVDTAVTLAGSTAITSVQAPIAVYITSAGTIMGYMDAAGIMHLLGGAVQTGSFTFSNGASAGCIYLQEGSGGGTDTSALCGAAAVTGNQVFTLPTSTGTMALTTENGLTSYRYGAVVNNNATLTLPTVTASSGGRGTIVVGANVDEATFTTDASGNVTLSEWTGGIVANASTAYKVQIGAAAPANPVVITNASGGNIMIQVTFLYN